MNHRDTLFLLRPGFSDPAKGDKGQKWFCPYAAQVRGMLGYYPELEATLEIVEIDFAKPRLAVVDLLGEDHQVTPVLVLHPDTPRRSACRSTRPTATGSSTRRSTSCGTSPRPAACRCRIDDRVSGIDPVASERTEEHR